MNQSERERLVELEEQCRQYEKKLSELNVVNRWKVGEYLHDSLAQKLNYAKILVQLLKKDIPGKKNELSGRCNEVLRLIDEGIQEVRDLSHDIIPVIGKEGIVKAFQNLKNQTEMRHDITCNLETGEVTKKPIERKVTENLYLIAQEAIKNAVTHGEAKHLKVALFEHKRQLYLHVKDDGIGFEPTEEGGVGLDIMKYRAEEIGGTFRIRPAKTGEDYSTYVTCTIPLEKLAEL